MSYTPCKVCLHISKAGLTSPDWLPLLVVDLPFQEYVEQLLQPQDPASLGNGEAGSGSGEWGTWETAVASTPAYHPLCWQILCTSLETTTSLSGQPSSSTTVRLHSVSWEPPLLTALELQVGATSKQTWGSPYIFCSSAIHN